MKISAKQYARGLYEAADGQTSKEQTAMVGRFLQLLKAQGRFSLANRVVAELEKIVLDRQGIVAAEVKSARGLSAATLQSLSQMIKDKTACREVRLTEKIAPEVLGGAVVKYQDKIINFSFQYFLAKMKQVLIK